MTGWRTIVATAGFMVLGGAASARADIIIDTAPPFPTVTDENILFIDPTVPTVDSGNTVTGVTNTTDEVFTFTAESSETLQAVSGGQARVEGSTSTGNFANLLIDAQDPTTFFTGFEANVNLSANGTVTIYVSDSTACTFDVNTGLPGVGCIEETTGATGNYEVATFTGTESGNNFFTVYAIASQMINQVLIVTSGSDTFTDLRQVRVGGVGGPNVPVIPEPASLLLFGTGLAGLGGAMRRRIQARKAAKSA